MSPYTRFIAASALGQLVGHVLSRLISLGVTATVEDPTSTTTRVALPVLMLLTGAVEGASIGFAQGWALEGHGATSTRAFALRTTVGMVAGWALGMSLTFLEPSAPPSPAFQVLVAAIAGGVLGLILGVAQRPALRPPPRAYLPTSAAAWSTGLVIAVMVESFVPEGPFTVVGLGIGAFGGLLAGAVVGAILGTPLFPRRA